MLGGACLPLVLGTVPARAQVENPEPLTVVSAASFDSPVAPDSLISIFGTRLASSTAAARLDHQGQLPSELAGTLVEINGSAVPLVFVSPEQINCLLPAGTSTGTAGIVVRSRAVVSRGEAEVRPVAPSLFTVDSSGAGPGAILNAVTFTQEPFFVETLEIPGRDRRTRLAVFGTGIRRAGEAAASAVDTRGPLDLKVEFAGAAPGFFGLDQINVVLPAELDGAGEVSLTVSADDSFSNEVTLLIEPLPASEIRLSGLTLDSPTVRAGEEAAATVRLNGRAPLGGVPISITSDSPVARVPPVVTVKEGAVSEAFFVRTSAGPGGAATLTASSRGETRSVTLAVRASNAVDLAALSITPDSVTGGSNAIGKVELSGPAPPGGVPVALDSDSELVQVPASVTVPSTRTEAEFSMATSSPRQARRVTITAALDGVTKTAVIEVVPLLRLSVDPNSVNGGGTSTATVTLGEPAPPGGARIDLRTSSFAAMVPVLLQIDDGQSSGSFVVRTVRVASVETAVLTATYRGASAEAALVVRPTSSTTLESLTLEPSLVRRGTAVTGTLTLTGPAPDTGVTVSLRSSNPSVARPPVSVRVPARASSAQFAISTSPVSATTTVTITALAGGGMKTAELTVN